MERHFQREERLDRRAAVTSVQLMNLHRRRGQAPWKHEDFMPHVKPQRRKQTPQEQLAVFKAFQLLTQGDRR